MFSPATPPMVAVATMASFESPDGVATNPPASSSSSSSSSPQQRQRHQHRPQSGSVSLDAIYAELRAYRDMNSGSLDVPISHPLLTRIAETLALAGVLDAAVVGGGGRGGDGGDVDDGGGRRRRGWDEYVSELRAYKARHGNCNVHPGPSGRYAALTTWTSEQRAYYDLHERGLPCPQMTNERYEILRNLGLTVNPWETRLDELRSYRAEHGDTDVPIDYPGLGLWVLNQRDAYHYERDAFPPDRIDKLEVLGFNWNRWGRKRLKVREEAWDTQYAKLVEFMDVHGHSNISQHDKDNERLGKWIKNQLSFFYFSFVVVCVAVVVIDGGGSLFCSRDVLSKRIIL